ncbi:MAG: (2Fe-2S)-binding protein [Deltaproteobacteria bacterium RBG_16_47_11]|jgi:carbon-monoxide dehydrogenase small subunit|nr:MAG: (2Fe-2S)-binding protein [Deltaproteobacteria bacterium RBG_16_47_11]
MERYVDLSVNGESYRILVKETDFLVDILRDRLGLTGTKKACDMGVCGSCTVLLDGMSISSCLVLALDAEGKEITTIEGLETIEGKLHPIQEAFLDKGAVQCGYCTPGMVLTAKAFLEKNPDPTETQIRKAIAGNLCRCTGYTKIVEAISEASRRMRDQWFSSRLDTKELDSP